MTEAPEIKVGQIWQEVGTQRFVRVREVDCRYALIRTIDQVDGGLWIYSKGRPSTQASVSRFHGRPGGYRLIQEPQS